ncbi:Uncharacterised protein [uncultured archaeon]|nr:Uncharacterised protein [uncultured archaeon]
MPVSLEAVEKARDELVAAIDDDKNQALIYDLGVITGTLVDFLRSSAQDIKNSAFQGQIPADLIKSVLEHLEDFHILSTRYFVRVASKYKVLLEKVQALVLSRTEDFSLRSVKNLSQITIIEKDWKEYEFIDTKACDAAEDFGREVATIVKNIIDYQAEPVKNCMLFAANLQMFVDAKEGIFRRFNDLLVQQRTAHIPRMLQAAQSLIEKKQSVFID